MYGFEFQRPQTLADAIDALAQEDAQALGGGQTLIPTLKARLAMPSTLVSLSAVPEIKGICMGDDGAMCVGGGTTHAAVAKDGGAYPALADLAGNIGDPAVRNRGTLGGSLANNDPSACYPSAVLASGATIVTDRRSIEADDFFQGMFATDLEEGELITEVRFPIPQAASYQKFIQPASRFALVGVFVAKFADRVRIAVTGASEEGVFRWADAEQALTQSFDVSALDALTVGSDGMITDLHGDAAYRAHLVKVLTLRAIKAMSGQ